MALGDHLYVQRSGYEHHGIDAGDGTVIHYTGEPSRKSHAAVQRTPMQAFLCGGQARVKAYRRCDPPDTVLERALSRLDEQRYDLFGNNCEHFARWCKTGHHHSEQVHRTSATGVGTMSAGAAAAGGLTAVGATGAVSGFSAAGITSGLATAGATVGGGMAAGIAVVGAGPALVATAAMQVALRDDEHLSDAERSARKAGRVAAAGGGVAAVVGSVAAVSSAGSVAGLSAAGVTSGLAALGATVGGGMFAGVALTAAAPAAAAVGVGLAIYGLTKPR